METDEIEKRGPADWQPESNKMVQAAVGKLGEEAAELAKVCCRISIQGLHSVNPATGKSNIDELSDEIADVRAMAELARRYLDLNPVTIRDRMSKKVAFKEPWLRGLMPYFHSSEHCEVCAPQEMRMERHRCLSHWKS